MRTTPAQARSARCSSLVEPPRLLWRDRRWMRPTAEWPPQDRCTARRARPRASSGVPVGAPRRGFAIQRAAGPCVSAPLRLPPRRCGRLRLSCLGVSTRPRAGAHVGASSPLTARSSASVSREKRRSSCADSDSMAPPPAGSSVSPSAPSSGEPTSASRRSSGPRGDM